MLAQLPVRKQDKWGAGHFGAPRGKDTHNGIDFACYPGTRILAVRPGLVTAVGYAYSEGTGAWNQPDPYRYVEVTDAYGLSARYFYLSPKIVEGQEISRGDLLGVVQELDRRYEDIIEHCHFEVMHGGEYLDPRQYLKNGDRHA